MTGQDGTAPADQSGSKRLVVSDPNRVVVRSLHLLYRFKIFRVCSRCLRINSDPISIKYIGRGKGFSVVPFYTLAQMKSDAQTFIGYFPGFGQITDNIHVLVVFDQAVVYQAGNIMRRRIRCQKRNQIAGITDIPSDQYIAISRLFGGRRLNVFFFGFVIAGA